MKLAVIADIHGNDLALEAVLADIEARGISDIVNLGDHLSGPLNARRTADLLMARNFPSIAGNHDRWVATLAPGDMGQWDRAAYDELEKHHLDWLRSLPTTLVYRDEIFLCHGTPESDTIYWLEDLTRDGTVHLAAADRIESFAQGLDFPLLLCAHTHIQRLVRLADGRLIVNPGSVGCQAYDDDKPVAHKVETGSPEARYAIVEKRADGFDVTFRAVAYENRAMAQLALQRGRPEWASALATGRIGE